MQKVTAKGCECDVGLHVDKLVKEYHVMAWVENVQPPWEEWRPQIEI